jgi:hypothetical protein
VTNPVPIDYEAVLADLRNKRDGLNRAIAAMEYWMLELPQAQPKDAAEQGSMRGDSFWGGVKVTDTIVCAACGRTCLYGGGPLGR